MDPQPTVPQWHVFWAAAPHPDQQSRRARTRAGRPRPGVILSVYLSVYLPACPSIYLANVSDARLHDATSIFSLSEFKSAPKPSLLTLYKCASFAPQRRALFRHLNFKKWSDTNRFFFDLRKRCALLPHLSIISHINHSWLIILINDISIFWGLPYTRFADYITILSIWHHKIIDYIGVYWGKF